MTTGVVLLKKGNVMTKETGNGKNTTSVKGNFITKETGNSKKWRIDTMKGIETVVTIEELTETTPKGITLIFSPD